MFNVKNEKHRLDAYDYINTLLTDAYGSSLYNNFHARCLKRRNAYYQKHDTTQPVWKSKLYFAPFFLATKALDASLASSLRQDPITQVQLEDGAPNDPAAKEKAMIAHYDINHDLYISRWRETHDIISWYVTTYGVGVGREYVIADLVESQVRKIVQDQYGMQDDVTESLMSRSEHTKTDAVHPLNFAHDMTVSNFHQSRWASVRYPLPISEIYKMVGDDNYYQPGVKELLAKLTDTKSIPGWTASKTTYYSDNEQAQPIKNSVIIDEYSGDLNFQGNYDDNNLYYAMIVRQYNIVLRIGKSPFSRHPYWKERAHPDPNGPYGVGPCDMLLPVTYLKNNLVNQYIDWGNANLKTMYEVCPDNIEGGLMSLITGQPSGFVVASGPEAFKSGQLIRAVQKDKNGIGGINELLNYIEKYEQSVRPSSGGRGKDDALNDTATAVGFMAQREDAQIQRMKDFIDYGLVDCMHMKMDNRINYMSQAITGQIKEGMPPLRYFPFELAGAKYNHKINRITPDVQSGKYMAWLKTIVPFMAPEFAGIVPIEGLARALKVVGRNMGVDEIDEMIKEPMPPQVNTMPGGAEAVPGGMPTPAPGAMPPAPMPQPQGAVNVPVAA
jgi:hypothetical protein